MKREVRNSKENMKKLIVIDACMRDGESRTKRMMEPLVAELGKRYEVETIVLDGEDYSAVGRKFLKERTNGYVPEETVKMAQRIAAADRILIAAPFWDMSFPAILKVFIEQMSLFNITFRDNGKSFDGLCRCEKVLYVTSRGMNIKTGDALDGATPYIKAISALWGLGEVYVVAAENMDYSTPEEIEGRIGKAVSEGLAICRDF